MSRQESLPAAMLPGHITAGNTVAVAPMAGVTDRPWRQLCRRFGANYAVGEMLTSRPDLQQSAKTRRRADHTGEMGPIAMQIVGTDPAEMALATRENIDRGAQVIDINMGCPVKKVCHKWAGSALMQNETLALDIVRAVVAAAAPRAVPVTVKMRTGWSLEQRNAPRLARLFEEAGVQMLTVHGRTREQRFHGCAEYDTIAEVKSAVRIPVLANGDIDSGSKARQVLDRTGADGVMIGRAALGRPWLYRQVTDYLRTGVATPAPSAGEVRRWIREHLQAHYDTHGEYMGVRTARKHVGWYVRGLPGAREWRDRINQAEDGATQMRLLDEFLEQTLADTALWPQRTERHTDNEQEEGIAA